MKARNAYDLLTRGREMLDARHNHQAVLLLQEACRAGAREGLGAGGAGTSALQHR